MQPLQHIPSRCLGVFFAAIALTSSWLSASSPAKAQTPTAEPLVVPFTSIPPFMQLGGDGKRSGFIVELSELIGAEIGVPIEYLDVANSREFIAAQVSGKTQIIAGILQLPTLAGTNVFSDHVAIEVLRPAVLERNAAFFENGDFKGQRIAIVPPAAGSEEPVLKQNIPIEFESPQAAVMALLSDGVEAVLLPSPVVYGIARAAGVDGRIQFAGPPLQETTRHIALHQSRADPIGPINSAIARLEADGRLPALRLRYNISIPPPPPQVLTVGASPFPPCKIIGPSGKPTGFSVEELSAIANRAGLSIEFKQISPEDWERGPVAGQFDMLTLSNIDPTRQRRMDFTLPTLEVPLSIFTNAGDGEGIAGLGDLEGQKVGVVTDNLAKFLAEAHGGMDLLAYQDHPQLLAALLDRNVDAALFPTETFRAEIEAKGASDLIDEISPPFHITLAGPALRFGLGSVRERLNAVIPSYVISDDYAKLRKKYFGKPVFWTGNRIYAVIALSTLIAFAFVGYALWQRWQSRRFIVDVLDKTALDVSIIDASNRYTFFNNAHRDLIPQARDSIAIGKDYRVAQAQKLKYVARDSETDQDLVDKLNPEPSASGTTMDVRLQDGRVLESTVFAMDGGSRLAIRRDVTQQRHAEEAHIKELAALITRLEQVNREQAEFTYAISHDLKSPANTIGMLIEELAETSGLDADGLSVLADMAATNARMRLLVDDVLSYSRIVDETIVVQDVELSGVVREVLSDLAADISKAGATISTATLPCIPGHRMQLKLLFQNLIANAVKFRAPDRAPKIDITAEEDPDGVHVTITDNGIGIPPEHRKRVFSLFKRLHTPDAYEGTGLGLTICQRVMVNHKGQIQVQPVQDMGSAFKMTFQKVWDD